MDELIREFIERTFIDEMKMDLYDVFSLFDKFQYKDTDDSLLNILTQESIMSSDDLQDGFISSINEKLDYLLEQHTVKLIDGVSIHNKIQILTALFTVQDLEDYTPISNILEDLEEDDNFKFASIVAILSSLENTYAMELIDSIHCDLLSRLKEYICSKEKEIELISNREFINTIKQFFSYIKTTSSTGSEILKARFKLGETFCTYLTFVKEDIIALDIKQTATNFLSVLMLSSDGQKSPLLTYREHSQEVLDDLNLISKVEIDLSNIYSGFLEYKRIKDEEIRLSQVSS